jgi:hypothetical protein
MLTNNCKPSMAEDNMLEYQLLNDPFSNVIPGFGQIKYFNCSW